MIDTKMFAPPDLQAACVGTKIDGVAAGTSCLATDRTVAMHEWRGAHRLKAKFHRTAMAGPLQQHSFPSYEVRVANNVDEPMALAKVE